MAARAENEREQDPAPRPVTKQTAPEAERSSQYQSVAALAAQYPDEIELVKVAV